MTKFTAQRLGDFFTVAMRAGRLIRKPLFVVHVEADDGSWCELDATSKDHAITLARNWVDKMDARGASCREVDGYGKLSAKTFYMHFAHYSETEG